MATSFLPDGPATGADSDKRICDACGVSLHTNKSRKKCEKCDLVCCLSCYTLRMKLPQSTSMVGEHCSSCQLLLTMQAKNRAKAAETRFDEEKISAGSQSQPASPSDGSGPHTSMTNGRCKQTGNMFMSSKHGRRVDQSRNPFGNYTLMDELGDDGVDQYGEYPEDDLGSGAGDIPEDIPYAMVLAGQVEPWRLQPQHYQRFLANTSRGPHYKDGPSASDTSSRSAALNKNKNKNKNAGLMKKAGNDSNPSTVSNSLDTADTPGGGRKTTTESKEKIDNQNTDTQEKHLTSVVENLSNSSPRLPEVVSERPRSPEVKDSKSRSPEVKDSKSRSPEVKDSKASSPEFRNSKSRSPEVKDSRSPESASTSECKSQTEEATVSQKTDKQAISEPPNDYQRDTKGQRMKKKTSKRPNNTEVAEKADLGGKSDTPVKQTSEAAIVDQSIATTGSVTDESGDVVPMAMRLAQDYNNMDDDDDDKDDDTASGTKLLLIINSRRGSRGQTTDKSSALLLSLEKAPQEKPYPKATLKELEDTPDNKYKDAAEGRTKPTKGGYTKREMGKSKNSSLQPLLKGSNSRSAPGVTISVKPVTSTKAGLEKMKERQSEDNSNTSEETGETAKGDNSSAKGGKSVPDFDHPVRRHVLAGKPTQALAEARHLEFKNIRKRNTGDHGLKCSACGRPECEGHIMQKMKEMIQAAADNGLEMRDVVPDGNCMFTAIVDQLELQGNFKFNHQALREAAVSWLIDNPCSEDGTPFASFLEESWESYVSRMLKDGQWGDHIILKAMVEVIQLPVSVLNANGSKSRITRFEPLTATTDTSGGDGLVLGHVGEFHYCSLRPAEHVGKETDKSMETTLEKTALNEQRGELPPDLEDLGMFHERVIVPVWNMPAIHLSYVLKKLLPVFKLLECGVTTSENCGQYDNQVTMETRPDERCVCIGPVAEGVYLPGLDATIDENDGVTYDWSKFTNAMVNDSFRVVTKEYPERLPTDYLLEEDPIYKGYAFITKESYAVYMPVVMKLPNLRQSNARGSITNSAAQVQTKASKQLTMVFRQECLAAPLVSWPKSADEWTTRPRVEGWPERSIVETIVLEGCLLVPEPHPFSLEQDYQWKISFALSEKRLFIEAVSPNQKHCYLMFKALCSTQFKASDVITDDHYKNIFFYSCERLPPEYWSSNPGACLLYMIDQLLLSIKHWRLDHYFFPDLNLFDLLTSEEQMNAFGQLKNITAHPILFLRQIYEKTRWINFGEEIIERIQGDVESFRSHRSVRLSALEVFIPTSIMVAQEHIRNSQYKIGYDIISQAYEERLAVSTCDDSIPFNMFLNGALSGVPFYCLVWFCVYTDKHLASQLPGSLAKDVCGDTTLVKIGDVVPQEVTCGYADSEIPSAFAQSVGYFCNDFAIFLYYVTSVAVALKPLEYFRQRYNDTLQQQQWLGSQANQAAGNMLQQMHRQSELLDPMADLQMFPVYVGLVFLYTSQRKSDNIRVLLPELFQLSERLQNKLCYTWLSGVCLKIGETQSSQLAQMKANSFGTQAQVDYMSIFINSMQHWCYTNT